MNEEQKLPLTGDPPAPELEPESEFDTDCQFLEDIQKRKADGPSPATEETVVSPHAPAAADSEKPEEFVEMETAGHDTSPTRKPQSRLAQLAERQMKRDDKDARRAERREEIQERRAERREEIQDRRDEKQARFDEHRFSNLRTTVFKMVEVGYNESGITRGYDILSFVLIILNVIGSIMFTFDYCELHYSTALHWVEAVTVAFFAIDYVLRLWTAPLLFPQERTAKAVAKYIFSFWGIIDLVSFLPYYLPWFFPQGGTVFRLFRVMRLFRLFRINAYYDSLGTITAVLKSRKQQLLSSIFILLVLMVSASLMMYSVENKAQPDVFRNALSGIWWASSALLTVGYGDVYPITVAGKIIGMIITFLGVGMVAIPTGIISAGFVEQYQRFKEMDEQTGEVDFHFIKVQLNYNDDWVGMKIMDLNLPTNVVVAVIQRGNSTIVPRGNVVLEEKDTLVLGAESAHDKEWDLDLKEIILKRKHPWNGEYIRDLDISRQTFIVLVRRKNRSMVPNGNLMLKEGDTVVLYSKKHIQDAVDIEM
ncbi:MAG: ion transporter [Clostridia bacterium]|nr:ion transporter [Clostridia bacterium]